jgi:WD40 repeat protein
MRIFLSFNSKDTALAEVVRARLPAFEPDIQIFFSPVSLGAGFWLPKLAEHIAEADAFLLLIGPQGIGLWQEVEYFTAFDRHVNDKRFALVPVIAAGAAAPGLPLLRTLNWVEAPLVTEDKTLHRLIAALKGETVASATPLWKLVNPYRGLEAMTEDNADYFFGRTRETAAVLNALAYKPNRCPILIGASGVGKSSVARAGVLSALQSMRWPGGESSAANGWPKGLQNSRGWVWLTMRPGEAPLEALTAAVIRLWQLDARDPDHAALPRKWAKGLAAGDNTLADLIGATQQELKKRQGESPERILLYVDQGEELYIRATRGDAQRFSETLAEGLGDDRLLSFVSLRADYFDRLQADEALFKCREHIDVPPLDRSQLLEVVTAPPSALGVKFEDKQIEDRVTNAAASEPGALPVLSYLLTDMWAGMVKRGDATLRLPGQAIDLGGVLAGRAEEFLKDNPGEETALRRLLTLKLAIVPPQGEPIRRQTTRKECTEAEWSLAARLAEHPWRLVVMGDREGAGRIVAEVAHEALLRAWPRLRDWLRGERDLLVFKGEVERAERRWRDMGQADQALLTGLDLARGEEWLPKRSADLSGDVIRFVQRSIAADRAAKERQLRFQRRVSFAAGIAALVMAAIGAFAWSQWGRARTAENSANAALALARENESLARENESRGLAALSMVAAKNGSFPGSIALALASWPRTPSDPRPRLPVILESLAFGLSALVPVLGEYRHDGPVYGARLSRDETRILSWSGVDKTARLWDVATGRQIGPSMTHDSWVAGALLNRDESRILSWSRDHTVRLWDVATGRQIGPAMTQDDWVNGALLSRDETRILSWSADNTVRLWDVATGRQIGPAMTHDGSVGGALLSRDETRILSWSADNTVRLWDVATGRQIGPAMTHDDWVNGALLSRDETRILSWSRDKTVRLWDVATGRQIGPAMTHDDWVWGALLSRDETRILSWSADKTVRLWDVATGRQIGPSMTHGYAVNGARLSRDETRILSWSEDQTVRLWDVATGRQIGPSMTHDSAVRGALLSRDETRILSWSLDHTVRLWDVATARQIGPSMTHDSAVGGALLSRDETRILSWSNDKTVRLWNVGWRGHNLLEIACNHSPPDHDLSAVSERYDIKITDPICQPDKVIPVQ